MTKTMLRVLIAVQAFTAAIDLALAVRRALAEISEARHERDALSLLDDDPLADLLGEDCVDTCDCGETAPRVITDDALTKSLRRAGGDGAA